MKNIYLLIFLLSFGAVFSQGSNTISAGYSGCDWSKVILNKNYLSTKGDTCIFVVSTRHYNDTLHEFMDYDYDTTGHLKYFAVYFQGARWTAVPYSNLQSLLDLKQTEFKNFVVLTEGLGKTFTSGMDRATRLMRTYDIDELFFDWPTKRPYMKSGKNFRTTYKVSYEVATPYARFLEEFQSYKDTHRSKFRITTLMFHSMGNLVLMYDLKNDLFKNIKPGMVDNVILNAACVPQRKHAKWLSKLTFSKNNFVTINNRDRNLNGARFVMLARILGEKVKRPLTPGVHYVSFSKVLEREHNYYLIKSLLEQKPYLKKFYADIFAGKMPVLEYPEEK
ncbi:MAG: alpha/beta hydrolase [Bacteroidia bacterium]|nr:alpha/beta hydrolase [Bacteroidia bacterium]